jgi:hypothetical protein
MRRKFKTIDKDINSQNLDWRKVYLDTKHSELIAGYSSKPASAPSASEKQMKEWDIERHEKIKKKRFEVIYSCKLLYYNSIQFNSIQYNAQIGKQRSNALKLN